MEKITLLGKLLIVFIAHQGIQFISTLLSVSSLIGKDHFGYIF